MPIQEELYALDLLVYSAHKTGTQTLVHSFAAQGLRSLHCHTLANVTTRLAPQELAPFLREYRRRRRRPLPILSVFREPIERLLSSFFQTHGDDALRRQPGLAPADTLIARAGLPALQERFAADLEAGILPGNLESIQQFCGALAIPVAQLRFDPQLQWGVNDCGDCRLHLFRFDSLMLENRLPSLLTLLAGRPIQTTPANLSAAKWYAPILVDFRASLRLPVALIERVYQERADLLRLMYPDQGASLLERTLARYGPAAGCPSP